MQVLNVIKTTVDNKELVVISFLIKQNRNSRSEDAALIYKAEETFKAIIKENSADEPTDDDLEDFLEQGIYEGETFTAYLHWSLVNKEA